MMPTALAAGDRIAYASTQNVEVDGKPIQFQMYALKDANGNDTNYIKLRDVAHVLNSTTARFSVDYDASLGLIMVATGQSYTDIGSEMNTPYSGNRACQSGYSYMLIDDQLFAVNAILLQDDQGGGYTYFKLRDLGYLLGFNVDWTPQRGVFVETGLQDTPNPPSSPQPVTPSQPSVDDLTAEVVRLVNVERAKEGLKPLGTYSTLTDAAQIRAGEIVSLFSHTRPDGSSCFTALSETGANKGAYTYGENIAAGNSTAAAVVAQWMDSPGHRANILDPDFTHIGVGYAYSPNSTYRYYWVQMFTGVNGTPNG